MKIAVMLILGVAILYMAKRWRDSSTECIDLRNQVASLKRQLKRVTRPGAAAR
ncbi:MAG: hypothetical protein IT482_06525 [Gammaproteobacteria bacterium]|nr:hypothetical protein [Gammaproteobacteria bacterium]